MFPYRFPTVVVTTLALLQPPVVVAQNIAEVNNIAKNITVKIMGDSNGSGVIYAREGNIYYVVTNQHVVPVDTEYQIQTHDGTIHQPRTSKLRNSWKDYARRYDYEISGMR